MKTRCSPYSPWLFFAFLGTLIFFNSSFSVAQCKGDFTFQSQPETATAAGKIEVLIKEPEPGKYSFTVYEMSGIITLVLTREASSPERIVFENLRPSTYFVKVEWGSSCSKIIGGLEGIIITDKGQGR